MTMTGTTIGAIIVAVTSLIGTIYTTYKSWQTNRRPQVIDAHQAQNEGWQALLGQYKQRIDDLEERQAAMARELAELRQERNQDRAWMRQATRYIYQLLDLLRAHDIEAPQPEFPLDR